MKVAVSNITSGYLPVALINSNFEAIQTAIENTLSRDGTSPNTMNADLDMNGYNILNTASVDSAPGVNFITYAPDVAINSGTLDGTPVLQLARYWIAGKVMVLQILCSFVVASGAPTTVTISLPAGVTHAHAYMDNLAKLGINSAPEVGLVNSTASGVMTFSRFDGVAFAVGTNTVTGTYIVEIA